mmetsp:Transcript_17735/g.28702  ORF Transcript_17735/g.28702 Transcript_17735/m.28702 type:complete len:207 (+) Transcript_17735:87-707(+)
MFRQIIGERSTLLKVSSRSDLKLCPAGSTRPWRYANVQKRPPGLRELCTSVMISRWSFSEKIAQGRPDITVSACSRPRRFSSWMMFSADSHKKFALLSGKRVTSLSMKSAFNSKPRYVVPVAPPSLLRISLVNGPVPGPSSTTTALLPRCIVSHIATANCCELGAKAPVSIGCFTQFARKSAVSFRLMSDTLPFNALPSAVLCFLT